MHLTYILLRFHATKENVSLYEEYNKEQIDLILKKLSSLLNQFWQILLKGKEEIRLAPQGIEALEVIIIKWYFIEIITIEELVFKIKNQKDNDLNFNIDNNDMGDDIKNFRYLSKGKLINK